MLFRHRSIGSFALLLLFLLIPIYFLFGLQTAPSSADWFAHSIALSRNPEPTIPITTHIVLFQFKKSASSFHIKEITSKMLALKKSCINPTTNRPYIKSITGGKDNSKENLQNGLTHAFIVKFASDEDRDFYVNEDPVHKAFKDAAGPHLEKAVVVDFQESVFT
ncbi:hypothetical protein DM02DRAFT_573372 [Periconia macrospinosa]|uniref:Stress-response A/B barrel domain-containing protein n=1 Tax=Periconia macrospinosa TaxID=97972 RepID=A0A2V1D7M6_9PLEO|nr:hypothetical protein DM02DRAFT_573372 [Periconia macrospinosa]